MSGCFSRRTSATGLLVLVHWSSGRGNPPLPVGGLTYGLPDLTRQQDVMVSPGYRLLLLFSATYGSTLPVGPFLLGIHNKDRMDTPLLEVHPPGDPLPDLPVPADTQRLRGDDVG